MTCNRGPSQLCEGPYFLVLPLPIDAMPAIKCMGCYVRADEAVEQGNLA